MIENGTLPLDALYFALKPRSKNLGEVDYHQLIGAESQSVVNNSEGEFSLFRVGDAVTSRNIHGALYESVRLCKDL